MELHAKVDLRLLPYDEKLQVRMNAIAQDLERQLLRAFAAIEKGVADGYEISVTMRDRDVHTPLPEFTR